MASRKIITETRELDPVPGGNAGVNFIVPMNRSWYPLHIRAEFNSRLTTGTHLFCIFYEKESGDPRIWVSALITIQPADTDYSYYACPGVSAFFQTIGASQGEVGIQLPTDGAIPSKGRIRLEMISQVGLSDVGKLDATLVAEEFTDSA